MRGTYAITPRHLGPRYKITCRRFATLSKRCLLFPWTCVHGYHISLLRNWAWIYLLIPRSPAGLSLNVFDRCYHAAFDRRMSADQVSDSKTADDPACLNAPSRQPNVKMRKLSGSCRSQGRLFRFFRLIGLIRVGLCRFSGRYHWQAL